MLAIALELANPFTKIWLPSSSRHFISIADAINHFDGTGLWDEDDGFYYDHLRVDGSRQSESHSLDGGLNPNDCRRGA